MSPYSRSDLVFLHGWGGSSQSWLPVSQRLTSNFHVHTPNLPGFPEFRLPHVYTLADYSDFFINFIIQKKINKPVLVGHSFGGAIAAKIAINRPRLISKLVLVNAACIRQPRHLKILLAKIAKLILFPFKTPLLKSLRLDKLDYYQIHDPNLKKTFQNIIHADLSPELSKISLPTLIIWGDNDRETPLTDGQKIHSLVPRSQFFSFPHTGHFSYLDHQSEFIDLLTKFVRS